MKGNILLKRIKKGITTPDWPQLKGSKGLRIGVLLTIMLITVIFFTNPAPSATMLLVDGQSIGFVTDENQVQVVIDTLKKDLTQELGITISGFAEKLTYDIDTKTKEAEILTNEELGTLLKDKLDWLGESFAITINDNPMLYLATEEEANKVLGEVKNYYMPQGQDKLTIEDISFVEDVKILPAKRLVDNLKESQDAVELMIKGLDKIVQHKVKKGDSLWLIAHTNNMTIEKLREINPEVSGDFLKPGQVLNLVKWEPLVTVKSTYSVTQEEKIPFKTVYESASSLWRGQQRVKQAGTYGSREVTYRVTKSNGQEVERDTLLEKILTEPITKVVLNGTKVMVASRGDGGSGELAWPIRGRLTSMYGRRGREIHTGLDIDGLTGDPVFAAEDGVVLHSGWLGRYGNLVIIDHGRGLTTRYGHLSSTKVSIGQKVTRGSLIGLCGSTGRSTGSHVHFEVRVNDVHKDPLRYLDR